MNQAIQQAHESGELTVQDLVTQVHKIQEAMKVVMKEGEHYGKIPGCGDKPALLKAGAEKLSFLFRLAPSFEIRRTELQHGHREYEITALLTHVVSGQTWGAGVGLCSSMETKYRYRQGERKCPKCGKPAIIKGRAEYGGGWVCYEKKGGCRAKYGDDDKAIVGQETGRTENPDIADVLNTVLKMAKKRALVDAILTATAASDIFTQDIDELAEHLVDAEIVETPKQPAAKPEKKPDPTPAPGVSASAPGSSANDSTPIDAKELKRVMAVQDQAGISDNGFKVHLEKTYGVQSRKSIPKTKLNEVIRWLKQVGGLEPPDEPVPSPASEGVTIKKPSPKMIESIEKLCDALKVDPVLRTTCVSRLIARQVRFLSEMTPEEGAQAWALLDKASKGDEASLTRLAEVMSAAVPF